MDLTIDKCFLVKIYLVPTSILHLKHILLGRFIQKIKLNKLCLKNTLEGQKINSTQL